MSIDDMTKEPKSPIDALAEFAKGLPESQGLRDADIRVAAQVTLNKSAEELTAQEAGSPDSELAERLKKALVARHGIPSGPSIK